MGLFSLSENLANEEKSSQSEGVAPNPADPIRGKEHWAFKPLLYSSPPPVQDSSWPQSPLDHFIQSKREEHNLPTLKDTDKRTLIRRATFQLWGLPPTEYLIERFEKDKRPEAFEAIVDELLASPHFGERWGRHWLDLARYADSNGLDENFLFREAWRYRNWVIQAINDDLPFDRFILEQIAGDLLPFEKVEQRDRQRIASGFMVMGPKVLLGNNPNNQKMEIADEQLETIGKAILGQSLGCARCHDHKFDPIPTQDYYALAGILTSTEVMERRFMLGQQRVMERLVGLGKNGDTLDSEYEKYYRERPQLISQQKQAQTAYDLLKKDEKAFQEHAKKHSSKSIAPLSLDSKLKKEERLQAQKKLLDQLKHRVKNPPPIPPRAMIPQDRSKPQDESIRLAGQFNKLGKKVPRGFLQVIGQGDYKIPDDESGRVELARWLCDSKNGAGQLAARVLANRIWYHLIGRGLVRTVDNFGRTGEAPSHPELLDYLAQQLIKSGWSMKSLVKEIVLSRTFRLSSEEHSEADGYDPDNVYLWRAHRRRLDPESIRDTLLMISGKLDLKPLDSSVWYLGDQATAVGANTNRRRTNFPNRSVYLPVIRNDLPEIFDIFDYTDPHNTTGQRPHTLVASQGLYFLNADEVFKISETIAKDKLKSPQESSSSDLVESFYLQIFNQAPSKEEKIQLSSFVQKTLQHFESQGHSNPQLGAWTLACQALIASSRFQILE